MKDNFFLYVGNAYPHKNVELLIRAAEKANKKIIFVGREDYFYKRHGIKPRTVSDTELTTLYKEATALVFPSLMEGFGLPVLEALRAGCPVIASDIPVFHELFGDAITYFDPYSVNDLVTKLQNPPAKPKNIEKILQKFSWRKMAEETLAVYEACDRV